MNQQLRISVFFVLAFLFHNRLSPAYQDLKPKKSLIIVFIGDSITEADGPNGPDGPVAQAAQWLLQKPGIDQLNFSNQGHSGFTTVNFLPSGGDTFKEVEAAADSLRKINEASLVFSIMLGTNDSAIDGPLGSPVSPAAYRANLIVIIDRLLKDFPKARFVIQHPTWYSPNTYNGSRYLAEGLKRLQSYFPEMDAVQRHYAHTNPHRVFIGDQQAFDFFRKHYKTYLKPENGHQGVFYLHPDKEGSKILGQYWAAAIYKLIYQF